MRVVVISTLGRLLLPEDFGVVAAAVSVMVILHQFRDAGIGPALIQRAEVTTEHVATTFAVMTYLGLGIAILMIVTAPLIGDLYNIPESVDILRAFAALFVFRGIGTASLVMCQRAMNFRAVALIDSASYLAGAGVSITLAVRGAGPWSLVGGYFAEELISMVLYLRAYPPPFTLKVSWARLRELLGFGASQSLIQIANVFALYGDNYVVGSTLGKEALGYYARAYDLLKLPAAIFTNVVGNVLFPAFSRLQDDRARLASGYRRITFINGLVLFPASAALIVAAPEAIRILMGPGWDNAVLPFRVLAITMMFRTHYKVAAMIASAAGHVHRVAIVNVIYLVCVITGALIGVQWNIVGVAISTASSLCVFYVLCSALALRSSLLPLRDFILAHVPGAVLAVLIGVPLWFLAEYMRATAQPFVLTFVLVAIVGIGLSLVRVWFGVRGKAGDFAWLGSELARVIKRKRPAAPPP